MPQPHPVPAAHGHLPVRAVAAYVGMVCAATLAFLLIRSYGEQSFAPVAAAAALPIQPAPSSTSDLLFHVLLALAVVIGAGQVLGRVLAAAGQPPVIGEVSAGIMLGPSLLGQVSPALSGYLLPGSVAPVLGVIAQLGAVLYMFLVGLELDADHARVRLHQTVATSHASILAPFVLGSLLALSLYPRLAPSHVPFTNFALFMGTAMSVTAFPVLARILTDRKLHTTQLGVVALGCAAADDATAWCLLAFVTGVVQTQVERAVLSVVLTAAFIAVIVLIVRPLVVSFTARYRRQPSSCVLAITLASAFVAALTTEAIGVHAIFGAFLFGAVVPHDSALARAVIERTRDIVNIVLLPAFFAFTGMRTRIDLLSGADEWLMCALIVVVATLGKVGGSMAAARAVGMSWGYASRLGVLMNTRGLMELIVLNVGLDLQIISPSLFAMMVVMALVTTLATVPLLGMLGPESGERPLEWREQPARATRQG